MANRLLKNVLSMPIDCHPERSEGSAFALNQALKQADSSSLRSSE
jgi:hypothetical protein